MSKLTLKSIIELIQMTNQYLNASIFWKIEDKKELYKVIGTAAQALKVITILLYPITPNYTETLLKYFKVEDKEKCLEKCRIEVDKEVVLKFDAKVKDKLFIRKLNHT